MKDDMEITPDQAQQSLSDIQASMVRTRRAMTGGASGPIITVWGLVWIAGYVLTFLFIRWRLYNWIQISWGSLVAFGILFTFIMAFRSPFRGAADKRVGVFWGLLFAHLYLWLAMMHPWSHYQIHAFFASVIMFAYVTLGLWQEDWLIFWTGLVTNGLIAIGYWLLHGNPWMWIWMAVFGGGTLTVTGLYGWLRLK